MGPVVGWGPGVPSLWISITFVDKTKWTLIPPRTLYPEKPQFRLFQDPFGPAQPMGGSSVEDFQKLSNTLFSFQSHR